MRSPVGAIVGGLLEGRVLVWLRGDKARDWTTGGVTWRSLIEHRLGAVLGLHEGVSTEVMRRRLLATVRGAGAHLVLIFHVGHVHMTVRALVFLTEKTRHGLIHHMLLERLGESTSMESLLSIVGLTQAVIKGSSMRWVLLRDLLIVSLVALLMTAGL